MSATDYETAKRVARDGPVAARAAVGAGPATAPELLYYLAGDPDAAVRQAVAGNAATPAQADHVLAGDAAAEVRGRLGRKLAAIAPALAAARGERLGQLAWNTLCRLVADTAEEVRAAIAEEIRAMPDAPHELILALARDIAMPVAEPVIRLSPVLTEADLLALVSDPPVPETVTALARRPGLSATVADAIIARADPGLVGVLLDNPSAAIREASLDALIAVAAERPAWHPPLVRRPGLSAGALRALAGFVAGHLLEALAARADLPEGLAERIATRLEARLEAPDPPPPVPPPAAAGPGEAERAFESAVQRGDTAAMQRILAEATGLSPAAVGKAAALRNAKALVSMCWRAGFSVLTALPAQALLGQIPPGAVLGPSPAGSWPLLVSEMEWQIELLAEPAPAAVD